ncbi:hypothetical protein Tco_1364824, partial [Tanacetum coccineum]
MSTFVRCVGCGEPLYGHPCRWCTCERCGNDLRDGYCFLCHSRNEDSFTYDSTLNSFDNPPDFSYPPPQPQYVPYSCELCGNDAHYGYDCPPQVPFDQFEPPQFPVIHQPIREKTCAELLAEERAANINTQPMQYFVVHQPPQEETSLEFLQDKRNLINSMQTFLRKFNRFSFYETPKVISLAWETIFEIKYAFEDKKYQPEGILELFRKLHDNVQNIHEELAEYINTPSWNRPTISCDDDDDEYSFATQEYLMTCSTAITPDPPKMDSLIMVDKHLNTILETESDEFIKSSVENLVQNPSESEVECECDVPDCDDSQTTNFSTFSNPLFDDSISSDDESSHEEVIHEMSFKTYLNPLFDLDKEIISSEFNPIHNEDSDSTLKNDRFDAESYLLELLFNRDTLMASSPKVDSTLDEFASELKTIPPGIVNREHEEYIS